MPSVRDIKRRIKSVQSTQQITKAMKMVAASKLRRTQTAAISARPYMNKLEEILGRIVASAGEIAHPLLVERPVQNAAIILITADKGLAGGYNANVQKLALQEASQLSEQGINVEFIPVGNKGRDFLRHRQQKIKTALAGINDVPTFSEAQQLAKLVVDSYLAGQYDQVYLVYQEFVTTVQQHPVSKQLLPLPYEKGEDEVEYLYEPAPQEVLTILLPQYINNTILHFLTEAKASEHGARMAAMTSATDNAEEMLDKLNLSYNRSRQAAITREISEIVGGANALAQ
ncbi:MAG: ATP synthase F1 subunit gamma [Clostridia bacterium]|jgi:F-type H+-transporting ATPase subunit gamma|nr:ATP synthase F1 subunit gamma [Clostridia bacterium]MDD4146312.1 ATP synthase F1 subunit gamma [Clostridia bacterium]MDD4665825.1 ATP synthase F1 subunit gamma [Clostridia bacterium]